MGILTFFRKLAADPAANTIVIAAVSLIPLLGMVGGAVDASRFYMTSSRLQAACDAGALAARRAMDDDEFNGTHKQIGRDFFDQNYNEGLFGLENRQRDYTSDDDGVVNGSASGKLPTSLMHIFGYEEFDISVTCSADINIANTDVVFVLDVTGSMNCPANKDLSCTNGNNNNTEYSESGSNASRIGALRTAVLDFYDVVDGSTSSAAQVRYGIVPYSSGVNVGAALETNWLATSATYQSRTSEPPSITYQNNGVTSSTRSGNIPGYTYIGTPTTRFNSQSFSACSAEAGRQHWDILVTEQLNLNNLTAGTPTVSGSTRTTPYTGSIRWKVLSGFKGGTYGGPGLCDLRFDTWEYTATGTVFVTETGTGSPWTGYNYGPTTWNVSTLYGQDAGALPTGVIGQISLSTGFEGAMVNHNWFGCVEEADSTTGASFDPIPDTAYGLLIDHVPTSNADAWKPSLPSAVFYRFTDATSFPYSDKSNWVTAPMTSFNDKITPVSTSVPGQTWSPFTSGWYACPTPAQKLIEIESEESSEAGVMDRTDLSTYLNSLRAKGATYHDFGMIWGARFISPDGIFSDENESAPNGDSIARHIIFMTDGAQATSLEAYGLYGIEGWDRRVSGDANQTTLATNHAARFQAICQAAKNKNISIWVVAFGTDLTSNLTSCATSGRAFEADNAAELRATFQEIAERIADLRLTK